MNMIADPKARPFADTEWRAIVRTSVYQLTLEMRCNPALRGARKQFYRTMLARHAADRRGIIDAFWL